jgi:(E)-4-hydroxy-3-methyl-but-2-enyl pyrophosphate reductase
MKDSIMEVIVAKKAGFCFGVRRAIDMAFELAEESDRGVFTLGPLIHNPQVVARLASLGVKSTEIITLPEIKTLLIRTHGVPPKVYGELKQRDYRVIDATCPFVKKAQHHAQKLQSDGYQVVILGDRNHPEVKGLMGFAGDNAIVVNGSESIPALKGRVGIVVQTTKSIETLKNVVAEIVDRAQEVKVYNTICDSTAQRLKETGELAHLVDIMIVVGGKNSANTTRLTNLCRQIGVPVYHIETSHEIDKKWFIDCKKVGITGGASTPGWIIDEVVKYLKKIH